MTTTEQRVKDPVCGMMIRPSEAAATVEHKGKTYYFCGQNCASSFRGDPETYAP
jgi:Cu+-exporting ATPase